MAGARIELDNSDVIAGIQRVLDAVDNPAPLFEQITSHLIRSHNARFAAKVSPQGTPWKPLSPAYKRRKAKNADKVLVLTGAMRNTLRGQYANGEYLFGTNVPYGAFHHFGGVFKRAARKRTLFFKQGRDGTVGNRFVKENRSNFAQDVTIPEHTVTMDARPWLGTSSEDEKRILEMTKEYLQFAVGR
jgi:phage virion morphogenesis protein